MSGSKVGVNHTSDASLVSIMLVSRSTLVGRSVEMDCVIVGEIVLSSGGDVGSVVVPDGSSKCNCVIMESRDVVVMSVISEVRLGELPNVT